MLDTLRLEDFAPRIGERFRVSADAGHSLDVTLIEAKGLGAGPQARRAPFSVVFLGPPQPVWAQRIYRVEHDAMGTFDLFLVPLGPRDGGMRYEAVFT